MFIRLVIIISLLLILSFSTFAITTVGLMDTGVDFTHKKLNHLVWKNDGEIQNGYDDDFNNYIDDIYGWNFIDQNNQTFRFDLHGTFSKFCIEFYQLRTKKTLGIITDKELKRYESLKNNESLKNERKKFRGYIHGTHVAGLSMSDKYKEYDFSFVSIKYLGKKINGESATPKFKPISSGSDKKKLAHLKSYLFETYLSWQVNKFYTAINYLADHVQVINGSFGQGYKSTNKSITENHKAQFGNNPNKELVEKLSIEFLTKLLSYTRETLVSFPNILFIFSAGNLKVNTDEFPHYPSNAGTSNSISVGASDKDKLAYFSNFGKNTVDLLAPGAAISSSIPENRFLRINGTSQSAPQVTNLALKLISIAKTFNMTPSPRLLKKIITETVDKKLSLQKIIKSSGIINPERAIRTIELLESNSLTKSINMARKEIPNQKFKKFNITNVKPLFLELPSPF